MIFGFISSDVMFRLRNITDMIENISVFYLSFFKPIISKLNELMATPHIRTASFLAFTFIKVALENNQS